MAYLRIHTDTSALGEEPRWPGRVALTSNLRLRQPPMEDDPLLGETASPSHSAQPAKQAGLMRKEVAEVVRIGEWLRRQMRELENQRVITSEEARGFIARIEDMLRKARQLGMPRQLHGAQARERRRLGLALLQQAKERRDLPRGLRRQAEQGRSTRGLRLIADFQIRPSLIRVHKHEAARISFVVRGPVRSISAMILSREGGDGTSFREFKWNQPTPGYKDAIWDGTFTGSRNRAPESGTYRVRVMVTPLVGRSEEVFDQIRVENPQQRTVLPRTQSGLNVTSLRFDGRHAFLIDSGRHSIRVRAVSGLKVNNPRNPDRRDYTSPGCQWLKDRGPLPEGRYSIRKNAVQRPVLDPDTGVLRFASGGTVDRWGSYRAPLSPARVCDRDQFFLHLDVRDDGTAGCIGVHPRDEGKFNQIMALLMWMPNDEVPVDVAYTAGRRDCYGMEGRDCRVRR